MTIMGLDFLKHEETKRSNLAREQEERRSNLAGEQETKRSNLARERETYRSNVAKESENVRYHNLDIGHKYDELAETKRINTVRAEEQERTNKANEQIRADTNAISSKYNDSSIKLKSEWQNYQYWYNDQALALQTKANEAQVALNYALRDKAITDREFKELDKYIQAARADAEIALNTAKIGNTDQDTALKKVKGFTDLVDSLVKTGGVIGKLLGAAT